MGTRLRFRGAAFGAQLGSRGAFSPGRGVGGLDHVAGERASGLLMAVAAMSNGGAAEGRALLPKLRAYRGWVRTGGLREPLVSAAVEGATAALTTVQGKHRYVVPAVGSIPSAPTPVGPRWRPPRLGRLDRVDLALG